MVDHESSDLAVGMLLDGVVGRVLDPLDLAKRSKQPVVHQTSKFETPNPSI